MTPIEQIEDMLDDIKLYNDAYYTGKRDGLNAILAILEADKPVQDNQNVIDFLLSKHDEGTNFFSGTDGYGIYTSCMERSDLLVWIEELKSPTK